MRRSDFLQSIPGGSLTRPPVPSSRCFLRSRQGPALPTTGLGFGLPVPLPALSGRRQQDLPSSRQILSIHALLPSDPGGTGAPGHSALAILPSAGDTTSAPTSSEFRGSITRPASWLSTLRSDGYPSTTQDSLPAGANLGRTGFDPQDLFGKFPSDSSHVVSSPFPELARRTPHFAFSLDGCHPSSTWHRSVSRCKLGFVGGDVCQAT